LPAVTYNVFRSRPPKAQFRHDVFQDRDELNELTVRGKDVDAALRVERFARAAPPVQTRGDIQVPLAVDRHPVVSNNSIGASEASVSSKAGSLVKSQPAATRVCASDTLA
jgi:hypothetical protein